MSSDLSSAVIPYTDELTEKFSCPICLEIYFEPCTTRCGHSFCKKCLQSSIYMAGQRCPLCKEWISNRFPYSGNIALWDAVQFLFPNEVKSRKAVDASNISKGISRQPSEMPPLDAFLQTFDRVMLAALALGLPWLTYLVLSE